MNKLLLLIAMSLKFCVYGVFLQCLFMSILFAHNGIAQKAKTLDEIDVMIGFEGTHLFEVFAKLESKTEFKFSYFETDLPDREISLNYESRSMRATLFAIASQAGIKFKRINNIITVDTVPEEMKKSERKKLVVEERPVSGKVTSNEGEPLPGVNVLVKGTVIGTITDLNGDFSIDVPDNVTTLVFSYVGFLTEEVIIDERSVINVTLMPDIETLSEIVVVGYGTQNEKKVTGSVYKVDSKQFESRPQTNLLQSLQGAIPGLVITRSGGGRVGREGNEVLIRGVTSRSTPGVLVVIDGIVQAEQNADALYQINPQDVESITVLKDAQAAIYGARAAGGVIIVTTKSGKSLKPTFKYSGNLSVNRLSDSHPKFANLEDFARFNDAAFEAAQSSFRPYQYLIPQFDDGTIRINDNQIIQGPFSDVPFISTNYVDWIDELYGGSRYMQTHNFSVSGNTEKSNYFISAGFIDQPGSLRNKYGKNSNKRYFARAKYAMDVRDNLTLSTNISVERQEIEEPTAYRFGQQLANGVWSNHLPLTPGGNPLNYGGFQSPIAFTRDGGDLTDINYRQNIQFGAEFRPIEGLKLNGDFSINVDNGTRLGMQRIVQQFNLDDTPGVLNPNRSSAFNSYDRDIHRVANLYGSYDYLLHQDHNFSVTIGLAHEEYDRETGGSTSFDLVSELLPAVGFGDPETVTAGYFGTHWAINSLFARASYSFKEKYIVEANYRRDASSRFAEDFRVGNFVGGSFAWNISDEAFMESLSGIFDNLKLRVSVGELGNQVAVPDDDPLRNFRFKSFININNGYLFGNPDGPVVGQQATFESRELASPERQWETTLVKNIGINFSLLDARLSGSFDYFNKTTRDVLLGLDFPDILGATPPLTNGGEIKTKGWEAALSWQDEIGSNFSYSVSFVMSDDVNEVTNLEDARTVTQGLNDFREGYSANSWFGPQFDGFINNQQELDQYTQLQGIPGNLASIGIGAARFKDLDGDGIFEPGVLYEPGNPESGDMVLIGNSRLRLPYSLNLTAKWKNFDIGLFLQGVGKLNLPNPVRPPGWAWWENPYQHFIGQTWTPDNTNALHPLHITDGGIFFHNYQASTAPYYWVKATYLRVKNFQLGYTIPQVILDRVNISSLRVYFSGNDLYEFTDIRGDFDPESYERNTNPIFRSYSFGLDLTF